MQELNRWKTATFIYFRSTEPLQAEFQGHRRLYSFEEGSHEVAEANLAMANMDKSVFQDPWSFNPKRADLDKSVAWNAKLQHLRAGNGNSL